MNVNLTVLEIEQLIRWYDAKCESVGTTVEDEELWERLHKALIDSQKFREHCDYDKNY